MKKHPKQAFGIFHDGLVVRIVHLSKEGDLIYLQAIDHTDLDKYWYKILDDPSVTAVDAQSQEDRPMSKDDIEIDEYDPDYVTNYQLQPSERMLSAFDLAHGVIALNVYEDNIQKDVPGLIGKKEMELFVRSKVNPKNLKSGEYKSSIVCIGDQFQHWLHQGTNRLFDLLRDYSRSNKLKLYYQLADANDIALTDYYKTAYENQMAQNTLLVYLGQEYRKGFIFKDGVWVDTLKLQISQTTPDTDVIASKLSLALDSAQIVEPEVIVFTGDLASSHLAEYMESQFPNSRIEMFSFTNIILTSIETEGFNYHVLSQYAIPIALAFKALHPEDSRFSPTNFLPARVLEGQKELKVAWHGFIILFLIFALAVGSTFNFLRLNQEYAAEVRMKQEQKLQLEQLRAEAGEIQRIRSELEAQEKNIQMLGSLLEGKNAWTELLSVLNRTFRDNPTSWLLNLKKDKEKLQITGLTTRSKNVINISNALTQSQIRKVTTSMIREHNIWSFDLGFEKFSVNWLDDIETELQALMKLHDKTDSETGTSSETTAKPGTSVKPSITKTSQPKTDSKGRVVLPLLPEQYTPIPSDKELEENPEATAAYQGFVAAINKGNMWDYRDLGQKFFQRFPNSDLISVTRWWLSYRLYIDKEYRLANQYLEPMLRAADKYYPHALLLQARIDYAQNNSRYTQWYNTLKSDYTRNPLMNQVKQDLDMIEKGGQQ